MASPDGFSLESVRNSLIRQEDTIIFSLIERSRYPINPLLYDDECSLIPGVSGSLLECIVKEIEATQAKFGRYQSQEEHSFFPGDLPHSSMITQHSSGVLHPAAASININKMIWDIYVNKLLPSFASKGDSDSYACIAALDLACLQVIQKHAADVDYQWYSTSAEACRCRLSVALSRRIHYGKFVAEVKFRNAPEEYTQAIRAQDGDALMKLLTFRNVEEIVRKRVEKKAKVFGQEVGPEDECNGKFKVDPSIVSHLYEEWVMPLTKHVQVEYLLRRLD